APIRPPVLVRGHRHASWLALGDLASEVVEEASDRVDQRAVGSDIGLRNSIESPKDEARPVHQQPFRQGRIMVRPWWFEFLTAQGPDRADDPGHHLVLEWELGHARIGRPDLIAGERW